MYRPDEQKIREIANANVEGDIVAKNTRYEKHIDWVALDANSKVWIEQEAGWQKCVIAVDTDYVTWMKQGELDIALHYDHDHSVAWKKNNTEKENVKICILDAMAKINATARCYSGGALCDVSLKYMLDLFGKDEKDRFHHISSALLKPFDFVDLVLNDTGVQADLYDVPFTAVDSWKQFPEAWAQMNDPAAAAASALTFTALQITARMEQIAGSPELAGKLGLQVRLKYPAQKSIIWVKATALHNFLTTGNRHYNFAVRWMQGPMRLYPAISQVFR